eukprot:6211455-Pleurochrysis_carterae.AAC.1
MPIELLDFFSCLSHRSNWTAEALCSPRRKVRASVRRRLGSSRRQNDRSSKPRQCGVRALRAVLLREDRRVAPRIPCSPSLAQTEVLQVKIGGVARKSASFDAIGARAPLSLLPSLFCAPLDASGSQFTEEALVKFFLELAIVIYGFQRFEETDSEGKKVFHPQDIGVRS